jgi:hypothetical protein
VLSIDIVFMIQNNPTGGRTIVYTRTFRTGRRSQSVRTFVLLFFPPGPPEPPWLSFLWTVKDGTTYQYGYPPMADGTTEVPFQNTLNKTGLDPSFQPTGGIYYNAGYRAQLISKIIFV